MNQSPGRAGVWWRWRRWLAIVVLVRRWSRPAQAELGGGHAGSEHAAARSHVTIGRRPAGEPRRRKTMA